MTAAKGTIAMIEGPTAEQERDHLAEQCAELLRENEGLLERLTGEVSYLTDAVIPALREENERLRQGFHTARGALLCIGATDSNWSEYARKVADAVGPLLDPTAYQQTTAPKETPDGTWVGDKEFWEHPKTMDQ